MAITATMVRELRELTGAGMMECKKALEGSSGDVQVAIDNLRKQGLKSAAKKGSRETSEGRVFAVLSEDHSRAHLVAIACETDFLAGSPKFLSFVADLETHVRDNDPDGVEGGERPLLVQTWQGTETSVGDAIQVAIGEMGENMRVVAVRRIETAGGCVGSYVHHDHKKGAIAAIGGIEEGKDADGTLRSLCQHAVVFTPPCLGRDEVAAEDIERERAVIRDSDDVAGKPDEIREKIVDGRMTKYFSQVCLVDQPWVLDDQQSVSKAVTVELGQDARVEAFAVASVGN